ncbi:unnamed protein product [Lymnaea stagnalis]|uniref:VWFA domain-containing protein n=1 Tax=Lymnaea stagnalis TaxID=6523 RepID=A0AAV2GYR8_LYMST
MRRVLWSAVLSDKNRPRDFSEVNMKGLLLSSLLIIFAGIILPFGDACFTHQADIVFVVDSSFSIRPDEFQHQLAFIRAVIDAFTIGQNQIQVGVVSVGTDVEVNIKLSEFSNKSKLKYAVSQIRHLEGMTMTHTALNFVHTHMFEPSYGGRPWAKHQVILITDGIFQDTKPTLVEASDARSKGIEIFSVFIGQDVSLYEHVLESVSSQPTNQHLFKVDEYRALLGIQKALQSAACHISEPSDEDVIGGEESSECREHSADVVFLMDSSSSMWNPDFKKQISFVQEVIKGFDIGPDATRVGVVVYSDAPITLVDLSDKQTTNSIITMMNRAPHIIGRTNTPMAIRHARRKLLGHDNARPHVAHVLIILTDGQSDDLTETIAEAELARAEGIQIFAIGIGDKVVAQELIDMATKPSDKFVFHVSNFTGLSEIQQLVTAKTCDAATYIAQKSAEDKGAIEPICPKVPTDAIFIYDKTALNRQHHNFVINVISGVTEARSLNSEKLRFGVVRDAPREISSILPDIDLTNQWTKTDFKNELDPESKTAGIDVLFRKVRNRYFPRWDHNGHKRIVVLFLDSTLNNIWGANIEAIRLKRDFVHIVVVTLGKHVGVEQVNKMASEPHDSNIIDVPHVKEEYRREVADKLLSILCQ